MRSALKRVFVRLAGWGFLVLGIAGLFLPILQGVLFIIIGLAILSTEYVWAHHLLAKLRKHFPVISSKADEGLHRANVWLHRIYGQRQ